MKIAVTGYCGTGSSAVLDLLSEYDSCTKGKVKHYEHIPFYTPNGLFDLEDKLLNGNNIHRSDEAIESFIKEMERLTENNFGWFGAYKKNYGNEFMKIYTDFINEITDYYFEGKWSYDFIDYRFSFYKFIKDIGKLLLKRGKNENIGKILNIKKDNIIRSSFVTEKEFFKAARLFVDKYMNMISESSNKNIIFDHLILPHNLFRIPKYFGDDFRAIVVERDIRDMYVLSKYIWPSMGLAAPFPKEEKDFVEFWKKMRLCEKQIEDNRILRINFEDLIYNYEDTVIKIEKFLNLDSNSHVNKKNIFIPEKSIKNTQNYLIKEEWIKEIEYIENNLSEYLYNFPYKIKTSLKETFDT